jgi:hypothetical protein
VEPMNALQNPPVTVIEVPLQYGSRGYGCKESGSNLLIPYNSSIVKAFSDVEEKKIVVMLRERFFTLPDYKGVV